MAIYEKAFDQRGVQWDHIVGDFERLRETLRRWRFPSVAGDPLMVEARRAQFDDFHQFYVLRALMLDWQKNDDTMRIVPISLWVDETRVVSYSPEPVPAFSEARDKLSANPDWVVSSSRLVYYLLDELLGSLFVFLDGFNERIAGLEESAFQAAKSGTLERHIFKLKDESLRARRAMASMRDAIAQLVRHWTARSPNDPFYYMELYDHMIRHFDTVDTYRELVNSVLDLHLSTVSNRLNEIVKTLTLVTTVLLPASLVAGLYGMNFDYLPLRQSRFGFFVILGVIGVISALVYRMFRRREWL